jgi:hypothetical protein
MGLETRGHRISKHSVPLPLSEEPGENSEPPSGASTSAEPPLVRPLCQGARRRAP